MSHSIPTRLFGYNSCGYSDNNRPRKLHVRSKPGHVFLIIEKSVQRSASCVRQVFGFYPAKERASLFGGDIAGRIEDNSNREYNASLSTELSVSAFRVFLSQAELLAKRKYNLRRFNCYDFVLEVFNAIPEIQKIPVSHIRLPYLLGRAGSPCGLYRDLVQLKSGKSSWAPFIRIGTLWLHPAHCCEIV